MLALRRKKKLAVRYASLSILGDAIGAGQRVRRHVPPLLFLLALALMIVAIARPAAVVTLPSQHELIILAMDVSGSMRAADVKPTRLAAAQEAARAFINDQPRNAKIGIVSFAGTAAVVQPPTENREELLAAIDRFQLQRATAIGSGILVSLKAIFPDVEFDLTRRIRACTRRHRAAACRSTSRRRRRRNPPNRSHPARTRPRRSSC